MTGNTDKLPDHLIVEAVARNGGYEEIERTGKWTQISNALGFRKNHGEEIKNRYEDLLRLSAEQDQQEDDNDEEHEVEEILDHREGKEGQIEYLVKWKGFEDDDEANQSWEPSANLSCPELVEAYEKRVDGGADADATVGSAGVEAASAAEVSAESGRKRKLGADEPAACFPISTSVAPTDGASKYKRVVGLNRPTPGQKGAVKFAVEFADGTQEIVDGVTLRQEAPYILLDFYEARIKWTT